jgi:4-amino-4-deoxy-L-arabinose transferase-like glycosyltransferase
MENSSNPRNKLGIALAVVALWAVLYLPNLRTNPNWYGDEGSVMDLSWTAINGHPRNGALHFDFIVPSPYQPLYLLLNGAFLRVLGCDLLSGRLLQVVIALMTAGICYWIGTRLRDRRFGLLCAVAFLTCPEIAINFRMVRPHPLVGMLTLASCGFMIRYIQEKRLRDIVLAGVMCACGLACHWFVYLLVPLVAIAAWRVNRRHVLAAVAPVVAYGALMILWFVSTQGGGLPRFIEEVRYVQRAGSDTTVTGVLPEFARIWRNFFTFTFLTPTAGADGSQGVDLWIPVAVLGLLCVPIPRFRGWLVFWLVALMYGVFKSRDNIPLFFYPAMVFMPLLAIGFAGAIVALEEKLSRWMPRHYSMVRLAPAIALLGVFGTMCLANSLGHWRTKIDLWTVHSHEAAEAAMRFVNAHTTKDDYVVMPDQAFWLFPHPYRSQLIQCAHYAGRESKYYNGTLPRELFWFDCSWQRAKYLVLAYGVQPNGQPYGIDAVYWMGFKGVREIIEAVQKEKWPIVFQQGEYMVLANPRLVKDGK